MDYKGLSVWIAQFMMEALSVLEDEQRRRRRASERAVDPVSRTLLATAEGHQEYIDQMGQAVPWWHHWLYFWVMGGVDIFGVFASGVFFWVWGIPTALPLLAIPLGVGALLLAWPLIRRKRGQEYPEPPKKA